MKPWNDATPLVYIPDRDLLLQHIQDIRKVNNWLGKLGVIIHDSWACCVDPALDERKVFNLVEVKSVEDDFGKFPQSFDRIFFFGVGRGGVRGEHIFLAEAGLFKQILTD